MPKQIMVTRNNAERFRDWQDAVTMEHFTLGDTVVRCAACGAVFHRRNVRETCLICQKPFVAGEVRTQTMHLTRGKRVKIARRPGRRARPLRAWERLGAGLCALSACGLAGALTAFALHPQRAQAWQAIAGLLGPVRELPTVIGQAAERTVQDFAAEPVEKWEELFLSLLGL